MGIQTVSQSLTNEGVTLSFKNRFINGNMTIDQRNNGSLVTGANNTTNTYMTDRWKNNVISGGGACSAQRVVDAPSGFQHSLKLTVTTTDDCSTATDRYDIAQIVEGVNIVDFALGTSSAKTFTVSFWVKSSVTGTYSFSVCTASADANYVSTYTINQANTWEYKTITVPPCTFGTWDITPGSSQGGMFCRWSLGAGSNISTSTLNTWTNVNKTNLSGGTNWISNSGATFQITGCQLELGSNASSFEYRPYATELLLCMRYFQYFYPPQHRYFTSTTITSGVTVSTERLSVPMRVAPSLTQLGNATTCTLVNIASNSYTSQTLYMQPLSVDTWRFYPGGTSTSTHYFVGGFNWILADAEI